MPGVTSRRTPLIGTVAVAVALLATVTGCGPKSGTAAQAGGPVPSQSAAAPAASDAPAASAPASASPTPVLPDGRSPVYLTTVDAGHRTLTFDLIEFLTGDAAKQAWKKANPGSSEDGPDDDYFIVNDNPKLRTLPVSATVAVSVLQNDGGSPDPTSISWAALPGYLTKVKPDTSDHQLSYNPFWLTVQNGQIVKIEEQFIP
jgi:hypothetical protein